MLSNKKYQLSKIEPSEIRLGVSKGYLCENLDTYTQACFDQSIAKLKRLGVTVVDIDFGNIWEHNSAFSIPVVLYEVMRELPNYLEKYVPELSFEELIKGIKSPDVLNLFVSQADSGAITEETYKEAIEQHRPKMIEIYSEVFRSSKLEAIIFPTTPLIASKISNDEEVNLNGLRVSAFQTYIRNTDLGSNLGVPCLSLVAKHQDFMPVGIEIDGERGEDEKLLSVGRTIEKILTS